MNEFSFRELECFLAVSEELSFTRAAERLHLAQPPLSRHIRNLEEKLGVQLFERTNRQVSLTQPGKAFRAEAQDILLQIHRAGEAARRAGNGETGRIEVGFVSAVLSPELVSVFSRFRESCPHIQLNLHDNLPADQLEALTGGELDIAFIGVAPAKLPGGIASTRWMEEPLMAFIPATHALSGRASIQIQELEHEPFVMISSEAAPAYAAHLRELCLAQGFRPRVVQEARRAQAVAAMTVAGSGVAILPASLNRITQNGIPLLGPRRKVVGMTHAVAHRVLPSETALLFLKLLAAK